MTSRKDYIAVAAAVRQAVDNTACHAPQAVPCVQDLAYRLAEVFTQDNPRFDRQRFLTACGLN